MAISCERFTQILEVISKEHTIDLQTLTDSLERKDLLPKKMLTNKLSTSKDKGPFDNKRAKEFAEANGICIVGIVGTGREGRITIADIKKKVVDVPVAGKVKISDAVAKLATDNGIDISTVTPSGKRGDILIRDVKRAIDEQPVSLVVEEDETDPVLEVQTVKESDSDEEPELEMDD